MKRILLIAYVVALFSMATRAAPKTLEDYKAVYEKEAAKIDSAGQNGMKAELERYGKKLSLIEAALKKAGDLDGVVAVKAEIARFERDGTIPDTPPARLPDLVKRAQADFREAADGLNSETGRLTASLIRKYLPPLTSLKKDLVMADALDEAMEVDAEIKRVEFVLADVESKLSKPEGSSKVEPQMAVSPKPTPKRTGILPVDLAKELILYYDFDKNEGDEVTDKSAEGNDGKVFGAKWTKEGVGPRRTARGRVSGAYEFDGNSSFIRTPHDSSMDSGRAMTVSLWVRATNWSTGKYPRLLWKGPAHPAPGSSSCYNVMYHRPKKLLRFVITGAGDVSFASRLKADCWYHFAGTCDGSTIRLYVDGKEGISAAAEGAINIAGHDLFIGVGEQRRHFHGTIDNVMVWNRALSESEIKEPYELQKGE